MKKLLPRTKMSDRDCTWIRSANYRYERKADQLHICIGCGKEFPRSGLERHHVVPHFMGGATWPKNVIGICARCHALTDHDVRLRMKISYFMLSRYGLFFAIRHGGTRPIVADMINRLGRRETDRQLKAIGQWQIDLGGWDEDDWDGDQD